MDESEELKTIVKEQNVLAEDIAVAVERQIGPEVGTRENIEEVIVQIEERIWQTKDAISLLDEQLHIVPITALKNLNSNYHMVALRNAKERLKQVQLNNNR